MKAWKTTAPVLICHSTGGETEAQRRREFGHLSSDTLVLTTETGCVAEEERRAPKVIGKVKVKVAVGE